MRSRMLIEPAPSTLLAGSKPTPSSRTSNSSPLAVRVRVTVVRASGPACFETYCSASSTQK